MDMSLLPRKTFTPIHPYREITSAASPFYVIENVSLAAEVLTAYGRCKFDKAAKGLENMKRHWIVSCASRILSHHLIALEISHQQHRLSMWLNIIHWLKDARE